MIGTIVITKSSAWLHYLGFVLSPLLLLVRWRAFRLFPVLFFIFGCAIFIFTKNNLQEVPPGPPNNPQSMFLIGYNWGIMHIFVQRGITKFPLHFAFEIAVFIFKVTLAFDTIEPYGFAAHFCLVIFMLFSHIKNELLDRNFFTEIFISRETFRNCKDFLSEYLPTSLLVLNSQKNKVLFYNKSFKETFKIEASNQCLERMKDMIPEFDHNPFLLKDIRHIGRNTLEFLGANSDILESGKAIEINSSYRAPDLTKLPFGVKLLRLFWDGQEAYAIHLQNNSLQQTLLTLKIANQNQEKAISTVAHELRNPVNGLLGIANLMEKNSSDPSTLRNLSILKSNISLLLNILNSVLDIQQIRADKLNLNLAETNLSELIDNIGLLYEFQFTSKNLKFKKEIDPSLPKVIVTDKNRLSQILINLTANALKFTLQGSITISVLRDPDNKEKVMFKVTDTGIGIKPDDCSKVFKMFGKLQSSVNLHQEGVGLGLMISNSLVKALNRNEPDNQIKVRSEYGKGSTFYFSIYTEDIPQFKTKTTLEIPEEYVPSTQNITTRQTVSIPRFETSHVRKLSYASSSQDQPLMQDTEQIELQIEDEQVSKPERNILLVDDDIFGLMAARETLKGHDFTCYLAHNGKEAVEKVYFLKADGISLDLILMDCEMPIMDGFEATSLLVHAMDRGEIPIVPIVGLSGNDGEEFLDKCKKTEMASHVCKPLTEKHIREILQYI